VQIIHKGNSAISQIETDSIRDFQPFGKKYFFKKFPGKKNVAKNALLYTREKGLKRLKDIILIAKIVLVFTKSR